MLISCIYRVYFPKHKLLENIKKQTYYSYFYNIIIHQSCI